MSLFVVRVWLPDRPGALGAVASRIGAVRGDVVGIDILERGGGRAIDELMVELADDRLVSLLVAEISQVDGVDVEDVRPVVDGTSDPRSDALETAALLVDADETAVLLERLVLHAGQDLSADWCCAVDLQDEEVLAVMGTAPSAAWLSAFVAGSRSSVPNGVSDAGPDDVAWADLPAAGVALVLGRAHRPLRARERRQIAALVRIADRRWAELSTPAGLVPPAPVG